MDNSTSKNKALAFYSGEGFVLFPLHGKVPPVDCHWRKLPYDPFPEFTDNFGVALRPEDLVIDVDPRNGGHESFMKLGVELPPTFTVNTGSGGTHFYFKKPGDFKTRKSLKEFKGIDFLSSGAYVVGLGSIHPGTGKPYTGQPAQIAQAPQALLDLIVKKDSKLEGVTDVILDDAQSEARYIEYLKEADPAVEGQGGDRHTFKVLAAGRDFGLSEARTYQLFADHYNDRCQPPWSPEDLTIKVQNVYKYAENTAGAKAPQAAFTEIVPVTDIDPKHQYFHRNGHGNLKLDLYNSALWFSDKLPFKMPLQSLLALDMFSHQIVFTRPAPWHHKHETVKFWGDEESVRCRTWLSQFFKFEPTQNMMHEAALRAAISKQFHPVKDYFGSLVWDGHSRLHNWMHLYLGVEDDAYTRAVGLKTLIAAVKRIYEPGCKFDYIPVLEGEQGTGKSTAWKILAGKQWFADTPIDIAKEWSIMKTFGKLMYEWAEMEVFRKANTQALRAFLSSDSDTVRLPYNRSVQTIPRQGIFVGTFNPDKDPDIGWLHDTTGNRRYWAVLTGVTGEIKLQDLAKVRDQLWAEAVAFYNQGVAIYFDDVKVIKMAAAEQAKRLGKDPWHGAIEQWLESEHMRLKNVVTGDEIFKDCLGGNLIHYRRPEMMRIGHIMTMLEWRKGVHYHPERKEAVSGYRRPVLE